MQIWVDADACPKVIRDILCRAAERTQVRLTLVANRPLHTPPSALIRALVVPAGLDEADALIARKVAPGDLVVTADIPLAAAVIDKGAGALTPRGELYDRDTVRRRLVMRDLMDELRGAGIRTGGPPPMSLRERKAFADALDRWLARGPR